MTEWSAPVERWVRRVTDRNDRILGAPARLLLDDYWSKADAPSKREPGPTFVFGKWVEFAEIARDFQCDQRTIRTQFDQLRKAGLARKGRGINDKGREVDGVWLADLPNTGRFDPGDKIPAEGHDDPPDRIKPSMHSDQTINENGSFDQRKRIKPSTKTDHLIRVYKEDPTDPTDPIIPDRASAPELDLFGNPVHGSAKPVTFGDLLTAWWRDRYSKIRGEIYARWRPDAKIRASEISKSKRKAIGKLLDEHTDASTPEARIEILDHVLDVIAGEIDADKGEIREWTDATGKRQHWDTVRRIDDYWLRDKHFARLVSASVPSTAPQARQPIKRIQPIKIDTRGFAPTASDIER